MREWFQRHIAPRSADEETARREYVLNFLTVGSIGLLSLYVIYDVCNALGQGRFYFGNILWILTLIGLMEVYRLSRAGRLSSASFLFLTLLSIAAFTSLYMLGSKDITVVLFALGVALTSMLLGFRPAAGVVILYTIYFAGLAMAEGLGLRPPPVATTLVSDVMGLGLTLVVLLLVEWLYNDERNRMLALYRAINRELEEANRLIAQQEGLRRELELAHHIQTSLLPHRDPVTRCFDIRGRSLPAHEVGGDFYSYLPLSETTLGIVVGDVSGKGMPAALCMAIAASMVEVEVSAHRNTAAFMRRVNTILYPRMHESGMNTALLYLLLDLERREMQVCNAGLVVPLLYRDGICRYLESYGLPLGAVEEGKYEERQLSLQQGDVILLFSDGIVEAMNERRELFGFARLEATLRENDHSSAEAILENIFARIQQFVGDVEQQDDMTLIAVKAIQ